MELYWPINKVSWSGWARSDASGLTADSAKVLASAPRRRHDAGVAPRAATIVSTVTVTFKKQGEQPT
jgi:hypothetical protein